MNRRNFLKTVLAACASILPLGQKRQYEMIVFEPKEYDFSKLVDLTRTKQWSYEVRKWVTESQVVRDDDNDGTDALNYIAYWTDPHTLSV